MQRYAHDATVQEMLTVTAHRKTSQSTLLVKAKSRINHPVSITQFYHVQLNCKKDLQLTNQEESRFLTAFFCIIITQAARMFLE